MSVSPFQFDLYRIIAPVFAGFLLILLVFSRSRSLRANPASNVFSLYALATVGFLAANTLEISASSAADNLFWSRVIYLFIPFIPMLWLSFSLRVARDGKPMEKRYLALLLVVPIITILIAFSDALMPLLWPSIEYQEVGGFIVSKRTHGPWFTFYAAYTYIVSLTGLVVVIRSFVLRRSYFQKRSIYLILGVSIPLAASLVHYLKPFPHLIKDLTPIGYAISAVFFFFVIHRLDAFSIVPVAREQLVERMSDGIVVFDAAHRIADANKAALDALGADETLIGRCINAEGAGTLGLPDAVVAAAVEGIRGVFESKAEEGGTAYYSVEPIDLPGRVLNRGRLLLLRDETELRLALARLEELARTDALTGLPNRRGFLENAESLISTAQRYGEPITAGMFDIDKFKGVNDEWGHAIGDEVLREFSRILEKNLRGADIVGRIGGEEFALLLPRTNIKGAFTVCERIRNDFFHHVFSTDQGDSFRVTVSVGLCSPKNAPYTVQTLLSTADVALYKAKSSGRNRTCVADEDPTRPEPRTSPA